MLNVSLRADFCCQFVVVLGDTYRPTYVDLTRWTRDQAGPILTDNVAFFTARHAFSEFFIANSAVTFAFRFVLNRCCWLACSAVEPIIFLSRSFFTLAAVSDTVGQITLAKLAFGAVSRAEFDVSLFAVTSRAIWTDGADAPLQLAW
jgi:hypothetical protein